MVALQIKSHIYYGTVSSPETDGFGWLQILTILFFQYLHLKWLYDGQYIMRNRTKSLKYQIGKLGLTENSLNKM